MSPLADSINKTLSYFSLFNYPLTKEELFAYLWQPPFQDYESFLSGGLGGINEKYGLFFLGEDEGQIENRRKRLVICEEKIKIARKAIKKIRSMPFLRAVFVCNSVSTGLAGEESDIDLFIIAAPKRIWLVRFLTNIWLKFFGLRTYGKKIKNRICLSFYVDENSLNLEPLKSFPEDIHFAYWANQMAPIYDPDNYYRKFINVNNWIRKFLPNILNSSASSYMPQVKKSSFGQLFKNMFEIMWKGGYGDLVESQARQLQLDHFKFKKIVAREDNSIVLGDSVIKVHENDSRLQIYDKWRLCLQG